MAHFWSATHEVINLFIFYTLLIFFLRFHRCYTSLFSEVCQSMTRKCLNWCSANKTYSILSWTVYILIALLKIMCSKRWRRYCNDVFSQPRKVQVTELFLFLLISFPIWFLTSPTETLFHHEYLDTDVSIERPISNKFLTLVRTGIICLDLNLLCWYLLCFCAGRCGRHLNEELIL